MIYGFQTDHLNRAIAAHIIYAIYRSRQIDKFKISTKMWDQITRFSKLSAKKSINLPEFIETFRKKMSTEVIHPQYWNLDDNITITDLIELIDEDSVLLTIINETAFVIMLVREKLEADKKENKTC